MAQVALLVGQEGTRDYKPVTHLGPAFLMHESPLSLSPR